MYNFLESDPEVLTVFCPAPPSTLITNLSPVVVWPVRPTGRPAYKSRKQAINLKILLRELQNSYQKENLYFYLSTVH